MKKKLLKIVGACLLLIVVILVTLPFLLEGKIEEIIKNKVNENVNATFDFADADLSLFSSFPKANVVLEGVSLVNKSPFEGDTLFSAKNIELNMSISEIFNGVEDPIKISSLMIDGAHVNIIIDEDGNANYDIGKETPSTATVEEPTAFNLNMESYAITNAQITYHDSSAGLLLDISEMNHYGNGDLSLEKSELDTKTDAFVTFEMGGTNYLNKNKIKLDALIGVDLKENKYSFLKNEVLLNQLPLIFDGFIKVNEDNQEVDVSFKTASSDFKNFLAVIPEEYSKNIDDVKTTGNFTVAGEFKGVVDAEHIPMFKININSNNASFKYPDLPKSVRNVFIDTKIVNSTGIVADTYVDINKLSFMIDADKFNMTSRIQDLMGNTQVNAHVSGKMNLANISEAYPVPEGMDLKGLLNLDITTAFDMASIENERYENTKTSGSLHLKDFEYQSDELTNPVQLNVTSVTFNAETVTLNELNGVTGKTDFNATGTIRNLLGFVFNDEKIEGNFNLATNTFALNDFMVEEEVAAEDDAATVEEKIKIPSFLDCTINATANTVLYDNLVLKDVSGTLRIKDEKAILTNMTSSLFDGKIGFSGEVSTKEEAPTFAMKLNMDNLKIGETFKAMELFDALAPIASILKGKMNSDIEISGNLTNDLLPDMGTISGKVLAEVLETDIDPNEAPLFSSLASNLNFLDFKSLDLKGLKTVFDFKDGKVDVRPFTINHKDIVVKVSGSHTFDKKLSYKAVLEVPARYLGAEVNQLISKIDEKEVENLSIPIIATIGGNYANPKVSTDLTSGIKNLTGQLVEIQKQKLLNQGKDKAKNLLGNLLSGNSSEKDTLENKSDAKTDVKEMLGGLLGGTTDKKDSTASKNDSIAPKKDVVKEAAAGILGGLLGKKKKKDTVN
ncbi:MAG: AsmA family protein [Flavobacteriaceae bacterium]|nr:MAG: AsmA family protein [Flavobacteriaceae bacterium]